ncbi:hypothetical protein XA68_14320 [Ophiocordyceps unilateralis]|uniref:Uncharacterized protein n=1 Tax=Ophiocordyceps unilateralis TaxID=268505 RepID=A0A2A9P9K1_OPHUN|nr:hypothetical protein XA68_14320 [Ophiocordyceps unilateralis]
MHRWLKSNEGQLLKSGTRGVHQPVLDNETREIIWDKVINNGEALKAVSAEMNVDVRRVAAVVRLKELERKWVDSGKQLATHYARAVLRMLPKTSWRKGGNNIPHEPINDIHVHKSSMHQVFTPTSESRHFTREDAAAAFENGLLSVDKRSPQPLLVDMEREVLAGKSRDSAVARFQERAMQEEMAVAKKTEKARLREEQLTTRVQEGRFEYRFREISVDDVGKTGRSRKGTGWRYGAPLQDRKRGKVKIPTSVPTEKWNLLTT